MSALKLFTRTAVFITLAMALLQTSLKAFHKENDAAQDERLKVYFVDVEGGQATLFVPPGGQSLLIDTGWPAHEARDADRIALLRSGLV